LTLTVTFVGTSPDGTAFREENVYERVSGSVGLIGSWPSIMVSEPSGSQETDGRDNSLTGPDVPARSTIFLRARSPTKIRYVMKITGNTDNMGEQTFAADGRSFSDVNWTPGTENEKTKGIFVKQ
jgi:hypothetical protein